MILQFQEYASSLLLCDSIGVEGPDTHTRRGLNMPQMEGQREPSRISKALGRFLRRREILKELHREQKRGNLACFKCRKKNPTVKPRRKVGDKCLCDGCASDFR